MRIAIIGCGQLSRMLALAGIPAGVEFSFIHDDRQQNRDCVEGLGLIEFAPLKKEVNGKLAYDAEEIKALYNALGQPDCVTVEKEQVDLELVQALAPLCAIYPSVAAIEACQHRGKEKALLTRLDIPTSDYFYNSSAVEAIKTLGLPAMVKSCTEGYDGKNQWLLKSEADAVEFDALNIDDYIIEAFVNFDKEVSQISVRAKDGQIKHYPLTDNVHVKGMLTQSLAPAQNMTESQVSTAQMYMEKLLNEVDYVGVMAMECFVIGDKLKINELAPRVHNSGHWTQSGSATCQFENHIRALANFSLGCTAQISVAGMLNLVGVERPAFERIAENAKLHWYNKTVKPNRKLGHINFVANDHQTVSEQMNKFS